MEPGCAPRSGQTGEAVISKLPVGGKRFYYMETREMCFEAKRLMKLALGPVLMLAALPWRALPK